MRELVEIAQVLAAGYVGLGVLFAVPFLARGATRVDSSVPGSTAGFRAVIVPGVVALWPLLLSRWLRARREEDR